jgi:hypothetical protein
MLINENEQEVENLMLLSLRARCLLGGKGEDI